MKQYKNISKSKQRNQEKKIQEVPLYKRTSNNACGTALWGEQKQRPFGGAKSNHRLNWWLVTRSIRIIHG